MFNIHDKVKFRDAKEEGDSDLRFRVIWYDAPRVEVKAFEAFDGIKPTFIYNEDELMLVDNEEN